MEAFDFHSDYPLEDLASFYPTTKSVMHPDVALHDHSDPLMFPSDVQNRANHAMQMLNDETSHSQNVVSPDQLPIDGLHTQQVEHMFHEHMTGFQRPNSAASSDHLSMHAYAAVPNQNDQRSMTADMPPALDMPFSIPGKLPHMTSNAFLPRTDVSLDNSPQDSQSMTPMSSISVRIEGASAGTCLPFQPLTRSKNHVLLWSHLQSHQPAYSLKSARQARMISFLP